MLYFVKICRSTYLGAGVLTVLLLSLLASSQSSATLDALYQRFVNPPDDARIMMRWWWFGPAVEKPELERELRVMKSAGIGGVEIQPVYPLELDDPKTGFHNTPYLSDEFLADVRFASETAKSLGLRVDITLGSGWPYGGPHTPVTQAAGRLRVERVAITDPQPSLPIPAMENGENLIAAFLLPGDTHQLAPEHVARIRNFQNGRAIFPEPISAPHVVLFFIASRTGQQVKRPSVGAEGFVLDHYNRAAIEHHLNVVGDRLLQSFGTNPPYAVFSDSLEVFASDWTDDFLSEFEKRRGYDLAPYLPALVADMGPQTAAIRHDWGKTLTELADEHYLVPIRQWAHAHHRLFRSQTYGEPPVDMSANDLVDLPEGEHGPEWRGFSAARWASSACHLYGRPITSTETWTWLHAPSFRATPLDMKAEADLHFIEGINQLIGHGWPYSPPSAAEPGWRFYASAVFNDHNPWFQVMPDLAKYFQRISYLMRQGSPANDVAIYLPTDDAWAQFNAGVLNARGKYDETTVSIDQSMDKLLGPALIPQILDAGYNLDFIDDGAIAHSGVPYKLLILPGVERIPLATLERILDYAQRGGTVIATHRLPSLAPGLQDANDTAKIQALAKLILPSGPQDEQGLGNALQQILTPDFAVQTDHSAIGFMHRTLGKTGDIYFVANTSNHRIDTRASIRIANLAGEWWDPFSAETKPLYGSSDGKCTTVGLHLAPYESEVIVFRPGKLQPEPAADAPSAGDIIDISRNWKVTFRSLNQTEDMTQLRSWTNDPQTEYYSGKADYEKTIQVPESFLNRTKQPARPIDLDFGEGEPVQPINMPNGMRALLESPVRESALVYVNGQFAGSVWHPPYTLPVQKYLHAGQNQLRLVVANLAVNEMAGRTLPTYTLLNERYGQRFQPQGFENFHTLPAGILGPIRLVAR